MPKKNNLNIKHTTFNFWIPPVGQLGREREQCRPMDINPQPSSLHITCTRNNSKKWTAYHSTILYLSLPLVFISSLYAQNNIPPKDLPTLADAMRKHMVQQLQQSDQLSELLEEADILDKNGNLTATDCSLLASLGISAQSSSEDLPSSCLSSNQDTIHDDTSNIVEELEEPHHDQSLLETEVPLMSMLLQNGSAALEASTRPVFINKENNGDIVFTPTKPAPEPLPQSALSKNKPRILEISNIIPPAPATNLPPGISFNKTVFLPQNPPSLILGAGAQFNATQANAYSLSQLLLGINSSGTPVAQIVGLTPANSSSSAPNLSVLNNAQIGQLAALRNGIVTTQVAAAGTTPAESLFFVPFLAPGTSIIQESDSSPRVLVDAARATVTTALAGLTTANQFIPPPTTTLVGTTPIIQTQSPVDLTFIAVPQDTKTFDAADGPDRGIAVMKLQDTILNNGTSAQTSFAFIESINKATQLNVVADETKPAMNIIGFRKTAGGIDKASVGASASLWWDTNLNRLYVGLIDVARDDATKEGGTLNMAMGYFSRDANNALLFSITPIVAEDDKSKLFTTNQLDGITGFYFDATNVKKVSASSKSIRTMRTSTAKSYVIFNGSMFDGTNVQNNNIFALPLLDDTSLPTATVGTMAAVDANGIMVNPLASPTDVAQMPKQNQGPVRVGQGNFPVANLQDLFVLGDSVYASFSDPANALKTPNNGLRKSTAIFDNLGRIISWTQQTPVGGLVRQILGAGLDINTGNFYALGVDKPASPNASGLITQWDNKNVDGQISLEQALAQSFPSTQDGIVSLFSFSDQRSGLTSDQISLLIAVGASTVALIQTGMPPAAGAAGLQPVTDFTNSVLPLPTALFQNIAPLTCAELVSAGGANPVYLYVGGYKGLNVLTLSLAGPLGVLPAPPIAATNIATQEVIAIQQIRSNAVGGGGVVNRVITLSRAKDPNTGIYTSALSLTNLNGTGITSLQINPNNTQSLGTDMTTIGNIVIVGTETEIQWGEITAAAGLPANLRRIPGITGTVMQLASYHAGINLPTIPGNVYALVLTTPQPDDANNATPPPSTLTPLIPHIYRLAVFNDPPGGAPTVQPIDYYQFNTSLKGQPRPFLRLDRFRRNIATDGSLLFDTLGKHFDTESYVRLLQVPPSILGAQSIILNAPYNQTNLIDNLLGIDKITNVHVGIPIIDATFGSWMIPGDWGIRINR